MSVVSPSVGVLVLNWNGIDDTMECVESLLRMDYPNVEIIVVDNGSAVSPRQRIEAAFPSVTIIETGSNLGFSGGNNVGIRYALEKGHDYVLVLNNDTVVDPGLLREGVAVAESDARIGVVGVKILAYDQPDRIWVAYGQVTYRQSLVRLIGFYSFDDGAFDTQRDVEWVPGTAMLMRRRAVEQIGVFDDEFFAYHEDVDWCTRARRAGWRVVFAPKAIILHKVSRSSGGKGYVTPRQYLAARNMILFVRKHATTLQKLKFIAFQVVALPLQYVRRYFTGEQEGVVLKIRGMRDALAGRPLPLAELGLRPKSE